MFQRLSATCEAGGVRIFYSGWKACVRDVLYRARDLELNPPVGLKAHMKRLAKGRGANSTDGSKEPPKLNTEELDPLLDPERWFLNLQDAVLHMRNNLVPLAKRPWKLQKQHTMEVTDAGQTVSWSIVKREKNETNETNEASLSN